MKNTSGGIITDKVDLKKISTLNNDEPIHQDNNPKCACTDNRASEYMKQK